MIISSLLTEMMSMDNFQESLPEGNINVPDTTDWIGPSRQAMEINNNEEIVVYPTTPLKDNLDTPATPMKEKVVLPVPS